MLQLVKPKAIIFDWDNTLVDSWKTTTHSLNVTLKELGYPLIDEDFVRNRPQASMRNAFPLMFGDNWEKAEKIYYKAFEAVHLQNLTPLSNVTDLLQYLFEQDTYLAVVSNKTGLYLRREVKALGWQGYFRSVIGARDTEKDKPSDLPVKMALKPGGLTPTDDVWFVGDSSIDVQCARNAECKPVFINSYLSDYEQIREDSNLLHLSDIKKLKVLLASLY